MTFNSLSTHLKHTLCQVVLHTFIMERFTNLSTAVGGIQNNLPDHLVPLEASPWALWRWVCVRGAGFPAQDVLKLALPDVAAAARHLLAAESTLEQQRARLVAAFSEQINQLLASVEGETQPQALRQLSKARKKFVKTGLLTDAPKLPADLGQAYQDTHIAIQTSRLVYEQALATGSVQVLRAIQELLGDERYQEAITWQNRQAAEIGLSRFLQTAPDQPQNNKDRRREEFLATYIQRYTVKNDSIGFFGPIGWAQFQADADTMQITPGPTLLATRQVYFEEWAITALAERLSQDEAFRPWFVPRLMPFLWVEGTCLHLQVGDPIPLTRAEAATYQACDGHKTTHQIAQALLADPRSDLSSEAALYDILQKGHDARRLVWAFSVPTEDAHPEKHLRRQLEQISDPELRQKALRPLNELEAARTTITQAAGQPAHLATALAALDDTFTRLTEQAATRHSGATYAARTLVYEDCGRDITIALGDELRAALAPPLNLLLTSARWYTYETARRYRQALRKLFLQVRTQLPGQAEATRLDFATYWLWAQALFFGDGPLPTDMLDTLFQRKWETILALPDNQRHVHYTSQQLQAGVEAQFRAPHSGWQLGRYHNPDVMLAAASAADIRQGNYQFVLGEFHLGFNSLTSSTLLNQHPQPDELRRQVRLDLSDPQIMPLTSRQQSGQTARTQFLATSADDLRLLFAADSWPVAESYSLPISELVVIDTGRELQVQTRDGRHRFDIIDLFAHFIGSVILDKFKLVGTRPHTPRITLDKLVVRRESWRFRAEDIGVGAEGGDAAADFLALQRWQQLHQLPRFVFVKTPLEKKPLYLDFDSPLYGRIFSRLVRQAQATDLPDPHLTITEMLPTHDNLWLPDAADQRYTSEMRLVAFDQQTSISPN